MKRFTVLLLLAAFTTITSGYAQTNSATDDAVSSISTIRRPSKATPTPANASGPKKPLEASLTKAKNDKNPTTAFATSIPQIYLQWEDDSAVKGEKLRVVWTEEEAAGKTKNRKISEGEETMPGPGSVGSFFLSAPSGGFPAGKYRADLYEAGKLAKTLQFTVTK
jgi:hypothetical protein